MFRICLSVQVPYFVKKVIIEWGAIGKVGGMILPQKSTTSYDNKKVLLKMTF
jgi:hypothetical protein